GERHNVPLYAANTLGGALGLGLAVGFLLPAAGVFGAMLVLMGVNLLLGCICLLKDRVAKRSIQQPRPATRRGTTNEASAAINPVTLTQSANGTISWLAMFSGAAVLAVEVLAVEMIHLKLPLSFYPAAAILACVILVLGLAAILVPFLIRRVRSPMRLIPPSLAAAGLSVVLAPVVFMNLGLNETHLGFTTPMIGFMAVLCLSTLLSIGPSMLFAGLVFPLCLASCEGLDRERQFRRISRLLALNGVGGLAGAECAYRVLLPAFGVHVGIGAVGLAYGMVSLAIQAILRSPKEAIRPSDAAPGMPSLEASPAVREPQPNY
ncbi:MAG: hypothetical protein K9N62_18025, partial [Verrucomicrobia bacterium]|nr:hypothetical protein [Verrucomicrobiota bacterium]